MASPPSPAALQKTEAANTVSAESTAAAIEAAIGVSSEATRSSLGFPEILAFIRSSKASEVLSDRSVRKMLHEVEEAQAREVYLMELVKKMSHSGLGRTRLTPARRSEPAAPMTQLIVQPPLRARSIEDLLPHTPSLQVSAPISRSFEDIRHRPCTPVVLRSHHWTLWSLDGSAFRRQDYPTEAEAMAAFDATAPRPCMLRDPFGTEVASQSWVASYYQLAPRIEITRCTTPLSVHVRQPTPVVQLASRQATPVQLRQPMMCARPPLPRVA